MAGYMKVSTQNIRQDRERIQQEMENMVKSISELHQEMIALGSAWEGPAWSSFQNQVASDVENMNAICEKISAFLERIEYAESEYKNCDIQVEQIVNGIRI